MEGNASVYQVYSVSRTTGEGRAEVLRVWGPDFDQALGGGEAGWAGGAGRSTQSVRGSYKSFKGISSAVLDKCTSSSCISCKSYNH